MRTFRSISLRMLLLSMGLCLQVRGLRNFIINWLSRFWQVFIRSSLVKLLCHSIIVRLYISLRMRSLCRETAIYLSNLPRICWRTNCRHAVKFDRIGIWELRHHHHRVGHSFYSRFTRFSSWVVHLLHLLLPLRCYNRRWFELFVLTSWNVRVGSFTFLLSNLTQNLRRF